MRGFRLRTESGSNYLVGPSADGTRVRVARLSDHPVAGTAGPVSFADDFERVELVAHHAGLRLRCTAADGTRFQTSTVVDVVQDVLASAS